MSLKTLRCASRRGNDPRSPSPRRPKINTDRPRRSTGDRGSPRRSTLGKSEREEADMNWNLINGLAAIILAILIFTAFLPRTGA